MEKKKSVPQPASSSEESSSGEEEEENEKVFMRTARIGHRAAENNAQQSLEYSESEEDGDEGEQDDEEDDEDEIDGTQRWKADTDESSSSEEVKQSTHNKRLSDTDSETSSASAGKPSEPAHQFVVVPRKTENANGQSGKKQPISGKVLKEDLKPLVSPKKGKEMDFRKTATPEPEKGSSKKQKKESSGSTRRTEHSSRVKDFENVRKENVTHMKDTEKKRGSKKSARAMIHAENPERVSTKETSIRNSESVSTREAAEKAPNDKKVVKNGEAVDVKGSLSPVKPKLFTGKDELVLVSEILHDLQQGVEIPVKKNDGYWSELADRVHERMEGSWSKEQLCEKLKRMKTRYLAMADKFRDIGEQKFRNSVDQELFAMWDQMWGNGDDVGDVKKKRPKVLVSASPVKRAKVSHDKVNAAVEDTKVVADVSEGHEGNKDVSESDDDHDPQQNNIVDISMEVDPKHAQKDNGHGPENSADIALSHVVGEVQRILQKEIRMTIAEALKEWQSEGLPVAVKMVADEAWVMNGFAVTGLHGLDMPLRRLAMRDLQLSEGDEACQKQWAELRLKELEVHCQRLELMLRECQLKQEQLKLQLRKSK